MKRALQIFSVLILSVPTLSFGAPGVYDWEAEEGGAGNGTVEREIQLTRNRNYPGGADEQDLKVQKSLNTPTRSPESASELVKREGAEPDDPSAE